MSEIIIKIEEEDTKGRAVAKNLENVLAEMTYSKAGKSLIIIDHTEVDDSLKGQGVGRKLLDVIVSMARERDIKIMPLCPFAKSVFDKDSSIRDVLK